MLNMAIADIGSPRTAPLKLSILSSLANYALFDLKNFDQGELMGKFGPKTGEWLWRICRGMDDEAVTPNLKPKSLSVCKSFA